MFETVLKLTYIYMYNDTTDCGFEFKLCMWWSNLKWKPCTAISTDPEIHQRGQPLANLGFKMDLSKSIATVVEFK